MKEIVPSMDSNLTFSLLKLLDCFFQPFMPKEVYTIYIIFLVCLVFGVKFALIIDLFFLKKLDFD